MRGCCVVETALEFVKLVDLDTARVEVDTHTAAKSGSREVGVKLSADHTGGTVGTEDAAPDGPRVRAAGGGSVPAHTPLRLVPVVHIRHALADVECGIALVHDVIDAEEGRPVPLLSEPAFVRGEGGLHIQSGGSTGTVHKLLTSLSLQGVDLNGPLGGNRVEVWGTFYPPLRLRNSHDC